MKNELKDETITVQTANSIYHKLGITDLSVEYKLKMMLKEIMVEEIDTYRQQIRKSLYGTDSTIGANTVIEYVCERYMVRPEELQEKTRKRNIVEVRQICHWMIKNRVCFNRLSLEGIGQLVGDRNHATVLHSIKTVNNLIETDSAFRERLMMMCNELGARTAWMATDKVLKITGYLKRNNETLPTEKTEQEELTNA